MTPTRPPTAGELMNDAVVTAAMDQAWVDSLVDDPLLRHEEGGWIYMNLADGSLSVRRAASGSEADLDLTSPPVVAGAVVVGKFHTHPNPRREGWYTGPSPDDRRVDAKHGVPDLIRADDGIHLSGPAARRGGLAGGPGYPS